MQEIYKDFYRNNSKKFSSARSISPIVLRALPPVKSAVDFGCGNGVWLSVLKELGVAEIHGIDGDWAQEHLVIPEENFSAMNMESGKIDLPKRYDLAMSLEVAEHLPPSAAKHFVKSLVHAADFVLFSAAIPLQGGTGHINEQWQDYWAGLFKQHNYVVVDFIRPQIWDDKTVFSFYRQNILFFVHQEQNWKVKAEVGNAPISIVHPSRYLQAHESPIMDMETTVSIGRAWKLFRRVLKRELRKKFR